MSPRGYTGQTASWEEASKCYYCKQQMQEFDKKTPSRNLTARVHYLQCNNNDCPYYRKTKAANMHEFGQGADGDRWNRLVEKLADGTVPLRPTGRGAKEIPRLPPLSDDARQRMEDSLRQDDELMQRLAKQGGARLDPDTGRVSEPPPE